MWRVIHQLCKHNHIKMRDYNEWSGRLLHQSGLPQSRVQSWFTSVSRVLPTSRIGYHAGKPIESVVFCLNIHFHEIYFYQIRIHGPPCCTLYTINMNELMAMVTASKLLRKSNSFLGLTKDPKSLTHCKNFSRILICVKYLSTKPDSGRLQEPVSIRKTRNS